MTIASAISWALDAMSRGYSYSFCVFTIKTNMAKSRAKLALRGLQAELVAIRKEA